MLRGLALTLLTVSAFLVRWWALSGPEPLGTDGYYYVVQIEDWVALGRLHVPDASWTLRALALPHVLGLDPVTSLALMASVLAALVVPAAAWVHPRAWPAAAWLAASPTLTHLAGDFPKSMGLAAPLLVLIGALRRVDDRRMWALVILSAGLAATAHRVGAALVVAVVVGFAMSRLDRRGWIALATATTAAMGFVGVAAVTPGWLHPDDLHRLDGQLRAIPWPPGPMAWPRPLPWLERAELFAPVVALAALPRIARVDREMAAMTMAAMIPGLFPFWRVDVLDMGYRLALWGPLLAWPALALTLPERPLPWGLLLPLSTLGFDPALSPPYAAWREVLAGLPDSKPDLLIAPQGMNFLYDHLTGREAMAWAPEPEIDRQRVGRIAWGIRPGEWAAVAQPHHPPVVALAYGYAYVREDLWEALLVEAQTDADLRDRVTDPRNPTLTRPASLRRGR
jgi:hypothetical protein